MNREELIEDEREALVAELRWLADAREKYQTDTFPSIAREVQTARQLADILQRKSRVADGGAGFGWIPSWLWVEWDEMAFRRSEVPEPSAAREFLKSALAESDADVSEGGAGWDVEVDARTVLELLDEVPEPQGEPCDAQVEAALFAFYGQERRIGFEWRGEFWEMMRAALRAAGGVR